MTARRLCCFAAGMLLLATPAIVLGSALEGDPNSTGVVAVDCSIFFEDRNESLAAMLAGQRHPWDLRPYLTCVDSPRILISWRREGRLYFFDRLAPGRYQLVKFTAEVPVGVLPNEKPRHAYDVSRSFTFELSAPERALLSADVTPGSVTYLGRVDIFDATFRRKDGYHPANDADQPELIAHYTRNVPGEATALRSLRSAADRRAGRKGSRDHAWQERLRALPDSLFRAALCDTIWPLP
jgi:hypothetical protein